MPIKLVYIFLLFSLIPESLQAQQGPVEPTDQSRFEKLWADLASSEMDRVTEAVLGFAKDEEGTVEFLASKVSAVRLDRETFEKLLADLCGDDKTAGEAANKTLRHLDPRLLMPVPELIEEFEVAKGNARFAEVIMDRKYGSLGDIEVPYNYSDDGQGNIASGMQIGRSNYWVSPNLKLLGELGGKKSWRRVVCVVKILEHIGSPEAVRVIARIAQGNGECPPTQLAREIGLKLKKAK